MKISAKVRSAAFVKIAPREDNPLYGSCNMGTWEYKGPIILWQNFSCLLTFPCFLNFLAL